MINIGDKVVCVNAEMTAREVGRGHFPSGFLVEGQTYCIAGIGPSKGVLIVGLPAINHAGVDLGWWEWRFRRVWTQSETERAFEWMEKYAQA